MDDKQEIYHYKMLRLAKEPNVWELDDFQYKYLNLRSPAQQAIDYMDQQGLNSYPFDPVEYDLEGEDKGKGLEPVGAHAIIYKSELTGVGYLRDHLYHELKEITRHSNTIYLY